MDNKEQHNHRGHIAPAVRDSILADIGRGKDSYAAIAARYGVSRQAVAVMARKRSFPSPVGPHARRMEALERALERERKAHKELAGKDLKGLDPDTLSKMTERAASTVDANLRAIEKADQPATTIIISPELRLLAVAFMGPPQVAERNVTPQLPELRNITPDGKPDKSTQKVVEDKATHNE